MKAYPAPFSTIRAIALGCRLPRRERTRATHLSTDCPQPDSCGLHAGAPGAQAFRLPDARVCPPQLGFALRYTGRVNMNPP